MFTSCRLVVGLPTIILGVWFCQNCSECVYMKAIHALVGEDLLTVLISRILSFWLIFVSCKQFAFSCGCFVMRPTLCVCIHACTCSCVYVCVCVSLWGCMRVRVCVCVCVQDVRCTYQKKRCTPSWSPCQTKRRTFSAPPSFMLSTGSERSLSVLHSAIFVFFVFSPLAQRSLLCCHVSCRRSLPLCIHNTWK